MNYSSHKSKVPSAATFVQPTTINLKAAKNALSALVARALAGEDIVITRNGEPAVRLVPAVPPKQRIPGLYPELSGLAEKVLEPMTEEELALWYDGKIFPDAAP